MGGGPVDLGGTESLGRMAGGGGDSYSSPSEQYKITPLSKQDTEVETMKDTQGEADHGIKCKYMLAARGYLSNTTFHGIPWVLEDISKGAKIAIVSYFVFMVGFATYSTISAIVDFYPNRPQKVSVLQEQDSPMHYPKLTICSPAFFNKERLIQYELDDENDDVANYIILSLQFEPMIPAIEKTEADYAAMEKRISNSMEKFGLTYMELLRKVAVTCDEFILFVREKTYSQNMADWPNKCGDVFYDFPILSSFGTCFMTNIENNLTITTTGFTERITILLDTKITINKNAAWLNDEALRSGVFFSLSSGEHHANSMALNSILLSPGTNNLIAVTKRRLDRSGYSEELDTWGLQEKVLCRSRLDLKDKNESSIPFLSYSQSFCKRKLSIEKFEKMMGCSMLAMFGTTDLVNTQPMCNRTTMQMMMPILRRTSLNPDPVWESHLEDECPLQCVEEFIDTEMSFSLVSDDSHDRAWKLWPLPQGRTKEEAVWMELFFKTLTVQVTKYEPFTIYDLLSSIGGTLGLFLGGSIFSIFESLLIFVFFGISMMGLAVRTAFQ